MSNLQDIDQQARDKLHTKKYRQRIEDLEERLHELAETLTQTKIDILCENGYGTLDIDGRTILVPEGITIDQLYHQLQRTPPGIDDDKLLMQMVSESDRRDVSDSDEYQSVVADRRDVLTKVNEVYREFWKEEVRSQADTDEEKIIYMLSGLQKDIVSSVLSDITGVPESKCRMYRLAEDGYVKKKNN